MNTSIEPILRSGLFAMWRSLSGEVPWDCQNIR